jgi:hypothetical protein
LCWLLLLEEFGLRFEYLTGKKNAVADALSRLDIDSLKIQEVSEELSTLLLGSENSSISNIRLKYPNAYCLDLQKTRKIQGIRIKRKGLSPTSLLNAVY